MKIEALKGKKIGVLMGGLSSEREVSLNTGTGVVKALAERGHDVVALDWAPGVNPARLLGEAGVEVVWNALHGTLGEDGAVQGLLECLGIPYTGSGILASALAMDKIASKRLFESHHLPTARWRVLEGSRPPGNNDLSRVIQELGMPIVVKPAREGSSVGVSVVLDEEKLPAAIALAQRHRGPVLIEEYVAGAELHIGILAGRVLGSIEVRPATGFYDYEAKYRRGDTRYIIPPEVDARVVGRAQDLALAAHRALGCAGHSRVDLRVTGAGQPFLLEVNTLPGMTSTSLLPKIAAHVGISYGELCEEILASSPGLGA